MKSYTIGKIFLILSIPVILSTCSTFAENDVIEELHNKSSILVSQERFDEALETFDQILEIDPNNVKALNHKGTVLVKIENFQQSLDYFNKALELQPNDIQILKNKAITLTHLVKYPDAISVYETILQIEPNNKWAEEERNYLLLNVGLQKTETQNKYFIQIYAVVRDSEGKLISVFENIAADFLPSKLTDKFLEETFTKSEIVLINDKKYEKFVYYRDWDSEYSLAYAYTTLMITDMLNDIQMIHYFSGYFPAIIVNHGEHVAETWTIFKQVD